MRLGNPMAMRMRPPVEKQYTFDVQGKYRMAAGDVKFVRNPGFAVSAIFVRHAILRAACVE
jgi:hypothetical protein